MEFAHQRIDDTPPCGKLGFCLTTDLTGNGRPDIIVGGRGEGYPGKRFIDIAEEHNFPTFRRLRSAINLAETNLFWYENPGFKRHDIAVAPYLDVGAAVGDITGNGRPDVIAGQGINHHDIFWFEPPADPRNRWQKYRISNQFEKYHDIAIGDVDGDGKPEVVGLSQESPAIFYYDVPADPKQTPWPDSALTIIDETLTVEGLEIVDLDGNGQADIIAGPNVFRHESGTWSREQLVDGWDLTRVHTGDVDGDGQLEIILSEGDSPVYGSHPGRVGWFDPPNWEATILADDLFCPHSLQVADISGNGHPDIYVAEMGLDMHAEPRHFLFENSGKATFTKHLISSGIPTHEAKVVDLSGNSRLDIAGKSYGPNHHVDIWLNNSAESIEHGTDDIQASDTDESTYTHS